MFTSDRDGNPEIYTINANGDAPRNLTYADAWDLMPVWGPTMEAAPEPDIATAQSHGLICFSRLVHMPGDQPNISEIHVVNEDGTNVRRVTPREIFAQDPSLSPDGTRIVFAGIDTDPSSLWMVNVDGSDLRELPVEGNGGRPSWSPDGSQITYIRWDQYLPEQYRSWIMNADGTNQRPLARGWDARISPDGSRVVHSWLGPEAPGDRQLDIWVQKIDGTGSMDLSRNPANDFTPVWSPDGTRIAFTRQGEGRRELWLMMADGSAHGHLPLDTRIISPPAWSPDGREIAFTGLSLLEDVGSIYAIEVDGRGVRQVTTSPFRDYVGDWR